MFNEFDSDQDLADFDPGIEDYQCRLAEIEVLRRIFATELHYMSFLIGELDPELGRYARQVIRQLASCRGRYSALYRHQEYRIMIAHTVSQIVRNIPAFDDQTIHAIMELVLRRADCLEPPDYSNLINVWLMMSSSATGDIMRRYMPQVIRSLRSDISREFKRDVLPSLVRQARRREDLAILLQGMEGR